MTGSKLLAFVEEFFKYCLVKRGRLLLVNTCQSSSGSWLHAKVVKVGSFSFKIMCNIPETFTAGKLPDNHRHKLAPTAVGAELLSVMMDFGITIKNMSRDKCSNLMKNCVINKCVNY